MAEKEEVKQEQRQMTLDSVLSEEPVESEYPEVRAKEKEAKAQAEGRARAEDGKFAKEVPSETKEPAKKEAEVKEEPKEVKQPPKQEFSDKERALLAAAQDERRKRQELERKLQETLKAQEIKRPEKPFWEAPDDHLRALEQQQKSWEEKQQERETVNLLKVSEMLSRREHKDFDEKVEHFGQMVQNTPGLYQSWLQSPDPGEFAYQAAKNHIDLQEAGNLDSLRSKMEKEIRVRVESELKEKQDKAQKEREALPGTLSDARGTTQQKVVFGGPTPLDDILKG